MKTDYLNGLQALSKAGLAPGVLKYLDEIELCCSQSQLHQAFHWPE